MQHLSDDTMRAMRDARMAQARSTRLSKARRPEQRRNHAR